MTLHYNKNQIQTAILLVDVGNSAIKLGFSDKHSLHTVCQVAFNKTAGHQSASGKTANFKKIEAGLLTVLTANPAVKHGAIKYEKILMASVCEPDLTAQIAQVLASACHCDMSNMIILSQEMFWKNKCWQYSDEGSNKLTNPLPDFSRYAPGQLGIDRQLAVFAAQHICTEKVDMQKSNPKKSNPEKPSSKKSKIKKSNKNQATIVLSFGTATTLDILSKSGAYLGGYILPGLQTYISILPTVTQLPALPLSDLPTQGFDRFGLSTTQSLGLGYSIAYLGGVATLLNCATQLLSQSHSTGVENNTDGKNQDEAQLVLTGGLAHTVVAISKNMKTTSIKTTLAAGYPAQQKASVFTGMLPAISDAAIHDNLVLKGLLRWHQLTASCEIQ
ncbi:MAG: type III pantothenate kinase [Cyanobacteria bacterium P01_H01_bin.74]